MYIPYDETIEQIYNKQEIKKQEEKRKQHNQEYIIRKLKEEKEYFDKMFKKIDKNIMLDENQRKIILTDEKNLMVIAGAGSGKTTTICAKINYLIDKQNIKDSEIIVISFTNKAVEELKKRINNDFKHNVKITTFHKLGYEIIKENTNKLPKVLIENKTIIKECIEKNIKKMETEKYSQKKNILKKYKRINIITKSINRIINLVKQNIINNQKNKTKIKEKIIKKTKKENKEYIKLCARYISLCKAKNIQEQEIDKIKYKTRKHKKLKEEIKRIYKFYAETLKEKNLIDFDDMISEATKIIKEKDTPNLRYKYIIIDEYQDISECRFNLIQKISEKIPVKIMVVGDDWQCIYSFASSNITLFTEFKKKVKNCEILKITNTYRNSQELIDIAGQFIQKNTSQIQKRLISNKTLKEPLTILTYNSNKPKHQKNRTIINAIEYIIKKYGLKKNILLLGRYTFDINKILSQELIEKESRIIYTKHPELKIDYMTIHKSKGLGYDNVILINAENNKLGFPSKVKTEKLLEPLMTTEKTIKYAEERRLFYVALTRTKNEIIILSEKHNKSKFIKEIKNNKNVRIKNNKIK